MTKYRLHYFKFRARAEIIRSILNYANVQYEEHFVKFGDKARLQHYPTHQVPVWEEIDVLNGVDTTSFYLTQSQTIVRYLGRKYGLLPVDDLKKAALIESVQDTWADLFELVRGYAFTTPNDEIKKAAMKKKLFEALAKHRKFHEGIIGVKMCYFENGGRLTVADLALNCVFDQVVRVDRSEAYERAGPQIVRVYERVNEELKAYHQSPRYLAKSSL